MIKRRRKPWQLPTSAKKRRLSQSEDSADDDITATFPDAVVKRLSEDIEREPESEDELQGAADQLRAGAGAALLADGSASPQSLVSPSNTRALNTPGASADLTDDDSGLQDERPRPRKIERPLRHVDFPGWKDGPAFPRRLYGWQPQTNIYTELEAVTRLAKAHDELYADADIEKPDYTYLTLDQFTIYRPADTYCHGMELVALDKLSRDRHPLFCFDGFLCIGNERCYVENVPFATLTVDGYGDEDISAANMARQLCIQSFVAQRQDAWYKLGKPAPEYRRFYSPFLWLVRFTKHFVDYLLTTERVTISHFRAIFFDQMRGKYGGNAAFNTWLDKAKLKDFRTTVAANVEFLWKECWGTHDPEDEIHILKHPVWGEVHPARLKAIPEQPNRIKRTIVTPFTADCFKSMYFADQFLETVVTDRAVRNSVDQLKARLGLPPMRDLKRLSMPTPSSAIAFPARISVAVGEVIMVRPDHNGNWKSAGDYWYAYIQRIRKDTASNTRLDVIWLYQAEDTTIGKATYRYQNELFFSDNCECGKDALHLDCVVGNANVTWFARDGEVVTGMFAWRKFRTVAEMDQYDYVLLRESDFRCHHQPDHIVEPSHEYAIGDTVLVQRRKDANGTNCDPVQIIEFNRDKTYVRLRRLSRQSKSWAVRPNELRLTSEVFEAKTIDLVRECHVRFFSRMDIDTGKVPIPYDRDGAGDFFYIASDQDHDPTLLSAFPRINPGWHPSEVSAKRKLTGLGIFCGGGTFDRGLEEGGSVKFRYAVDWAQKALHSYKANRTDDDVKFFLGSVDDYLAKAMAGHFKDNVARPGSIHLISAGSPCQGFSRLQLSTASPESKKNASMVASVVSFVDFYVPECLILENVISMTESVKERKEHNVFAQIIAALVGLGYQVQQFLMDAWSYGSPQQRSRVFIVATAPGMTPLSQPEATHAHPTKHFKVRKLGTSSNGKPFGTRQQSPFVPFPFVTAAHAVSDLPAIYDALPQLCPQFPDHRAQAETNVTRERIAMIPTRPRGYGLVQAKKARRLRGEPLAYFDGLKNIHRSGDNSKSYSRIDPDHLYQTIVTKLAVSDGINGRTLHWDQHRPLSLMETRRAQGYLDHEVIVGSHAEQMKIVGNSVDRKVALVLGLALRQSWLKFRSGQNVEAEDAAESDTGMFDAVYHDHDEDENPSAVGSANNKHGIDDATDDATAGGMDTSTREEREESVDFEIVDNRLLKMSLILTQEEIAEVRQAQQAEKGARPNAVQQILRIMESREHRAARQSLHGDGKGGNSRFGHLL